MLTCRLHVPIQARSDSSVALLHSRYMRIALIVNVLRSTRRTDKVDEMSHAFRLLATTHRGLTSGKHPLELEPSLRPALTFTCPPQRTIRAFRRCAGKGWLHQLCFQQQHDQLFCAMRIVDGQRVMGVSSYGKLGDEPEARLCDTPVCTVLVVVRSPTCNGLHAGCMHGIRMVGSFAVAYCMRSARINRVRMMALRSGGARGSRRWHDLHATHDRLGENRHVYGCTV